jgi:hypothetical protein
MSTGATATKPMTADEFFEWVHRPDNTELLPPSAAG